MAKVSDFGLSLMGPKDNESHLSLHAAGMPSYVDPKYYRLQILMSKSTCTASESSCSSYYRVRAIHNNEHDVPWNVVDFLIPYILQDEIHRVLDQKKEVQKCLRNAHYLKGRLREAGISAMLNELSSTVVFERPSEEEFVRRWQLACEGNIAHVVVMPSVSIEKLDGFVNELIEKRSTWYRDGTVQPPCLAVDVGAENCCCALHK
ncbi:hypothetical protein ACJRO7_026046 [Eucalyptus globulus]|uniref:Uncharacterized protein n=1 Tax=Eucalyptus globulus TaxID=34317 RepID=A0ABD3KJH0_EUCGL